MAERNHTPDGARSILLCYDEVLTVTVLSIIAASTNNEKYHKFYAVFFFIKDIPISLT